MRCDPKQQDQKAEVSVAPSVKLHCCNCDRINPSRVMPGFGCVAEVQGNQRLLISAEHRCT